jgi:hypothetical protein
LEFSSACFLDLLQNNDWFKAPQNANVIPAEQLLLAQDALYIVVLLVPEVPYL